MSIHTVDSMGTEVGTMLGDPPCPYTKLCPHEIFDVIEGKLAGHSAQAYTPYDTDPGDRYLTPLDEAKQGITLGLDMVEAISMKNPDGTAVFPDSACGMKKFCVIRGESQGLSNKPWETGARTFEGVVRGEAAACRAKRKSGVNGVSTFRNVRSTFANVGPADAGEGAIGRAPISTRLARDIFAYSDASKARHTALQGSRPRSYADLALGTYHR